MTNLIAALPMYDWPERRAEVDAEWAAIRDALRALGIAAPADPVRRNADMPGVPGGIRDRDGRLIAPDPATLPPDRLDFATLWRHPALLVAQTCWGPLHETDLAAHVAVVGQPDYSAIEGGSGTFYSSAIVVRPVEGAHPRDVAAPADGRALLPLEALRGARFAYNEPHSMSGLLALESDLRSAGATLEIFRQRHESGGHRQSIREVAEGRADVATIDCRSWSLARRFDPAAARLAVVGWTARRPGLPFVSARGLERHHETIRRALSAPEKAGRLAAG